MLLEFMKRNEHLIVILACLIKKKHTFITREL